MEDTGRLKRIVWCILWLAALSVGLTGCTGTSSAPAEDVTSASKTQPAGNSDIRPVPRPLCKGFYHRVP